jgi:excisionase family DNA binding protein
MAQNLTESPRQTLTVQEAARVLGISRDAAYQAVSTGEIPSFRIGRRILVSRMAIDRLLTAGTTSRQVEAA